MDLHGEDEERAGQHPGHIITPVNVTWNSFVVGEIIFRVENNQMLRIGKLSDNHHV